jgi:multicomponent Na+:H+ antiporter subunit F
MSVAALFDVSLVIAMALIGVEMALVVYRLLRGPTLADRILALDTLSMLGLGFIGVFAMLSRLFMALDIALALALTSFLATAALARYLARRGKLERHE